MKASTSTQRSLRLIFTPGSFNFLRASSSLGAGSTGTGVFAAVSAFIWGLLTIVNSAIINMVPIKLKPVLLRRVMQ
jgi:hypothetical protein